MKVALEVVKLTAFDVACDGSLVKMTFPFQCTYRYICRHWHDCAFVRTCAHIRRYGCACLMAHLWLCMFIRDIICQLIIIYFFQNCLFFIHNILLYVYARMNKLYVRIWQYCQSYDQYIWALLIVRCICSLESQIRLFFRGVFWLWGN